MVKQMNWYVVYFKSAEGKMAWTEEILCSDDQNPLDYVTDFVKNNLIRIDLVKSWDGQSY